MPANGTTYGTNIKYDLISLKTRSVDYYLLAAGRLALKVEDRPRISRAG